ncbi:MAG: alternate-type signal peptide domain-containing protein [Terrimesophilobacter sp.]
MNKLTKSAIAGAAGIALLLGGAGSLAYWNSSATVGTSTINSGQLTIAATGTTTTAYTTGGGPVGLIVPGDSVTLTQPVTITATGDNLKAALTIDQAALAGSLKDLFTTPFVVTAYVGGSPISGFTLSNMTGAQAATITSVRVVVVFPSTVGDTVGTEGQNGSLQLGTLKVMLNQIP